MGLKAEQRNEIQVKIRHFHQTGDPIKAMYLQKALDSDQMPDPSIMSEAEGINTDIPLVGDADLTIPPRTGKGSGRKAWIGFAAKVSDVDAEALERMSRDDIIGMLKARGNIPSQ